MGSLVKTFAERMAGLFKAALLFKTGVKVLAARQTDDLIILGNGPSLSQETNKLKALRKGRSVCAVNYFAATAEFEIFKPELYVIVSEEYWKNEEKQDWAEDRKKLFENLRHKTAWPLDLFVPVIAKGFPDWVQYMSANSNIRLNFYNTSPLDGSPKFFHFLLKRYWACPRPHNVLIPSILIGINLGFKRIILCGSDHSWLSEISVNAQNEVLIGQKHFYAHQFKGASTLLSDQPKPMYKQGSIETRRLHEVLEKFCFSFKAYWFLLEYAALNQAEIVNVTTTSYIDAYKKVNIDELPITT
ncbi:MAG: hypothetical protein ACI8ZN_002290 [Bacteroidia bacterium]